MCPDFGQRSVEISRPAGLMIFLNTEWRVKQMGDGDSSKNNEFVRQREITQVYLILESLQNSTKEAKAGGNEELKKLIDLEKL